jgi:hypothetical protein
MKPVIDDLPQISASRLRALGEIGRDTTATIIRFDNGESGVEFVVGVTSMRFRHGGDWSLFQCRCGRRCQKLRLFEGKPTCAHCIRATGMRYRIEMVSHASKRVALTAPKRIARLVDPNPVGIKGRVTLPRRGLLEARLRRSLIVARQYALDEHEKMLDGK